MEQFLNSLEPQNESPPELITWAKKVFNAARNIGRYSDDEIAEWVTVYAHERKYTKNQIFSASPKGYVASGVSQNVKNLNLTTSMLQV